MNNWLINAFNGEWLKTEDPVPMKKGGGNGRRKFKRELEGFAKQALVLPD
jgi:hypothetical protein